MRRLLVALSTLLALAASGSCSVFSEPDMVVQAKFRSSTGLYEGNEVAVLGIPVGHVTEIRPQGKHVLVTLSINAGAEIPVDAVAAMVSPSVVTDRHVELTPAYRGGPKMRGGDLIPLDRTRTPVEIDRVIAAADQLAAELARTDGGKGVVRDSVDVAAENLQGNGRKINETITSMSRAVGTLSGKRDALTGLIRNVEALTKAAARNEQTIRSFTSNLTEVTELFAENSPEFGTLMTRVNKLLDETESLIGENRKGIRTVLDRARVTTSTLMRNQQDLAEAVDLLPLTFQNLAGIVDPARRAGRVHGNLDDIMLDPDLLGILCDRIGVQLPGCQTGRLGDFGPDLGITELLLGVVK